jgi:ABC-type transporter Mla subunit MlaD
MSRTVNLSKSNKAATLTSLRELIAGTQQHTPSGSLTFGNATYTSASLVQLLQSLVDAMAALNDAEARVKDVTATLRDLSAKVRPVVVAYRKYLVATYGNATQTLADYGLKPHKAPAPRTSEQKAAAAAQLRATRKARGTTSKKQKASIKGVVTPAPEPPVAAPPAPSPSPAKPTA